MCALFLAVASADEPKTWTIAASEFTLSGVSDSYASYASVIPRYILSALKNGSTRLVSPTEAEQRELTRLSDARLKLVIERSVLVDQRARIVLDTESKSARKKRRIEADSLIEKKELEISAIADEITRMLEGAKPSVESLSRVTLWKGSTDLYRPKEKVSLARSMRDDGIQGLITGSIRDIGGYMHVTCQLSTGLGDDGGIRVAETAPYDDMQSVIGALSARLVPVLTNRRPVTLSFSLEPKDASLFIDGRLIEDPGEPVTVFSGQHTISASASGHLSSVRTADFGLLKEHAVTVRLTPVKTVSVAFETKRPGQSLFFHTSYYGQTPASIDLPAFPTIGEAVFGDVKTFFVFDPAAIDGDGRPLLIEENEINTERRIETRRRALYWSLGLLYLSLPVSMISSGIYGNKARAYNEGKLAHDQATLDDIETWGRVSDVSGAISIGLGINLAIQLVRYIMAADQVMPKTAR